jgi:hypothetical protein
MKIHMRLPIPPFLPPPPPKPAPTAFQLAMQAEELAETAQQQQSRLKKLFGLRRKARVTNDDTEPEEGDQNRHSKSKLIDRRA